MKTDAGKWEARMPEAPFGIAVLGLGRIGLYHSKQILHHAPNVRLVAALDTASSATEAAARELPGVHLAKTLDEILDHDAVEGVLVATPSDAHVDIIERASQRKKHILCEKPISLDLASTRHSIKVADDHGVLLHIGFQFPHEPHIKEAKAYIDSGELGEIYYFHCNHRDAAPPSWEFIKSSGGIFVDDTIHDFDLARFLVGEVVEVSAAGSAKSPGFADHGDFDTSVVTLRFANGALGVINNTRVAGYGFDLALEIIGSKGSLRFGPQLRSNTELLTSGSVASKLAMRGRDIYQTAFLNQLAHFVDCARANTIHTNARDAERAFVLSLAADKSARTSRVIDVEAFASALA